MIRFTECQFQMPLPLRCHRHAPSLISLTSTLLRNLTDIFPFQVTQRRVPTSSRQDVLNATLSRRARETRSVQTCTGSSAVRLVPLMASHIPMPTRPRVSLGPRAHWYDDRFWNWCFHLLTFCSSNTSRTQRSTFPAQRWLSVVSRRTRTGTT